MRMRVARTDPWSMRINYASITVSIIMANETTIEVELWLRVLHSVLGSTLLLCNSICSCTVILVIAFNKKLHYPSMVMNLGLVIAELILSAIWLIQVIAYSIAGRWQLGKDGCIHFGMILVWMLYVRWCEVAVVTLDRFHAAMVPFEKYKMFHKRFLVAATILAWVLPALLVIPSTFGFGRLSFRPQLSACTVYCEQKPSCIGYYTILFLTFQIIGGVIPFILYTILYCIGRRKRTQTLTTRTSNNIEVKTTTQTAINHNHQIITTVTATIPARVEHAKSGDNCSTSSTDVESLRPHLPNQQERNSSVTIFIIFVTMILTHIPIYCTSVLEHIGNLYVSIPLAVHLSAVYVFLLGVFINSVVIMRNKDFREVLEHLTRKCTSSGYSCPRSGMNGSIVSVDNTGIHQSRDQVKSQE